MPKRLFPDWSQWSNWTLPSKASYYSAILATVSLVVTIVGIFLTMYPVSVEEPTVEGPVAVEDRITEANLDSLDPNLFSGNVIYNDSFGSVGPGTPPLVLSNEEDRERGYELYETDHGTIRIREDGSYLFTIDRFAAGIQDYHLNYTIQNANGDRSSALLRFTYYEDGEAVDQEQ